MSLPEVVTTVRPDELKVLKLMREEGNDDVDFFVCRREGRIVKTEKNVKYVKEFKTERLKEPTG